ncbi:acid phosphatase [Beijerinckia indica]|uniref:acid phosphatase n=1 Tax=Beijerinckia indica TaxID=533 RepID=UPI0002D31B34|nr:phosphatase PAP2 family protein [Beijerinckia indica]
MKKNLLSSIGLLALSLSLAQAKEPIFVQPDQTTAFEILPPPPAADSEKLKKELAELHKLEAQRTEEQVRQAKADDELENMFVFKTILGDRFTPEALPATARFSDDVKNDEGFNTAPAKEGFHRVRPYNLDKTLTPVCKVKTKDDSYPSGHATTGYLEALALIDLLPEKRDIILVRADEYARNRLVCGVHYRSDIEASKLLAYAIHALMHSTPKYKEEMLAARAELRAVFPADVKDQ